MAREVEEAIVGSEVVEDHGNATTRTEDIAEDMEDKGSLVETNLQTTEDDGSLVEMV